MSNSPSPSLIAKAGAMLTVLKSLANTKHNENQTGVLAAASAAALLIVLGSYFTSKESKLVHDLSRVGKKFSSKQADDYDEFDVIICGGGTAGCVLASRLTEDPSIKVLVLEAGGSGVSLFFSRAPAGYGRLFHSAHDYDLYTVPQKNSGGIAKYWPRAKMLGGCSSINAQMAQFGAPSDFDEWANITGDDTYSWENFKQYIKKFEDFKPDPRYPKINVADRGSGGPVRVGFHTHLSEGSRLFVETCPKVGVPFSPDFNSVAGTLGVNRIMSYVDPNGARVSTETAYLTNDVLARPNLTVATHAQVTKILIETLGGVKRAIGVEFSKGPKYVRYRARARKEVVVTGGAIHSPHMLMLSGIGPADQLREHGIQVVQDLPGVGQHMLDHYGADLMFRDKAGYSPKFLQPNSLMDVVRMLGASAQYALTGKGPMSSNVGEAAAFIRSDDPKLFPSAEYPKPIEDANSGPGSPDIELISVPLAVKDHNKVLLPQFDSYMIKVINLRPTSIGELRLQSADPFQNPIIDPRYNETQHDVDVVVRGVKLALKIARTVPLADMLDHDETHSQLDHQLYNKGDTEIEKVVRERSETLYHPACTCRMAPLKEGGVVDNKHRVYGVSGLRVCDLSTFPNLISGHPTGACIAMAEKLADILKSDLLNAVPIDN